MPNDFSSYAIVADIGGTFARFSRINLVSLVMDKVEIYPCAAFISLESVLMTYQAQQALGEIKHVALAIACPVLGDWVSMTNCHWCFSIQALKQKLDLIELKVMNDFNAIAMSLPVLAEHQIVQIGEGKAQSQQVKVVLGAGTGLGLAYLVPGLQGYIAFAGEGGHASWAAQNAQEWFIYNELKKHYGHVSYERILSGQGLENIYKALALFHQQDKPALKAAEIITQAIAQKDSLAQMTVAQFFVSLGAYAGDVALSFGALGGVYIAGGIAPRLLALIKGSEFRANFENKGRFAEFNLQIPTYIITAEQPGLLGAAISLQQALIGECHVVS